MQLLYINYSDSVTRVLVIKLLNYNVNASHLLLHGSSQIVIGNFI